MNNTSDSSGINMDADVIFALYQLEGEREIGRINIKILKNRLGGYVDRIFPMLVNYDTLKISDWNCNDGDSELDDQVFEETPTNKSESNVSSDNNGITDLFKDL